jgi:uncharacterized membrane protein YgcG
MHRGHDPARAEKRRRVSTPDGAAPPPPWPAAADPAGAAAYANGDAAWDAPDLRVDALDGALGEAGGAAASGAELESLLFGPQPAGPAFDGTGPVVTGYGYGAHVQHQQHQPQHQHQPQPQHQNQHQHQHHQPQHQLQHHQNHQHHQQKQQLQQLQQPQGQQHHQQQQHQQQHQPHVTESHDRHVQPLAQQQQEDHGYNAQVYGSAYATPAALGPAGGAASSAMAHSSAPDQALPYHAPVSLTALAPAGMSLGQVSPVREALAVFDDRSAPITALDRLLASDGPAYAGHVLSGAPPGAVRARINAFAGFAPNVHPDVALLTALTKPDLDSLAWAFSVNRTGRKADVARRIVQYLRVPIEWAEPTKRRVAPAGTTVSTDAAGDAAGAAARADALASRRRQGRVVSIAGSDPRAVGAAAYGATAVTNSTLYSRLVEEMNGAYEAPGERSAFSFDFGAAARRGAHRGHPYPSTSAAAKAAAAALASGAAGRGSGPRGGAGAGVPRAAAEAKFAHLAPLLDAYDFQEPENPFHVPDGAPLCKYVLFSADQLSRGTEPSLSFGTPEARPGEEGVESQVHLRCLKADAGKQPSQWVQSWPFPASAKMNGHHVDLNQAQRYTSGKLAGTDMATNVSPFLRKFKAESREVNRAQLRRLASLATAATGVFVLFVQEVRVKSVEVIRAQVVEQSAVHWQEQVEREGARAATPGGRGGATAGEVVTKFDLAKRGVVQFMTADDELTSSSMRVSLRCPLMLTRIVVPVKGRRCTHVQCFDLDNFLAYARRSSKFVCPVCNKPNATPSDLLVSPYIEKALEVFGCDDVEIDVDGVLTAVVARRTGVRSDDEDGGSDDGDEEGGGGANASSARQPSGSGGGGGTASGGGGGRGAGIVDLTLSDDEGEGGQRGGDGGGAVSAAGAGDAGHGALHGAGIPAASQRHAGPSPADGGNARGAEAAAGGVAGGVAGGEAGGSSAPDSSLLPPPGAGPSDLDSTPTSAAVMDKQGLSLFEECVEPEVNAAWSIDVITLDSD